MARRNVGKEIDNFVKTFLAVSKMGWDRNRADERDKETKRMNDARIKLYEARAQQTGKGMGNFDEWIRQHMNGGNAGNSGSAPRTTEQQRIAAQERMNYLVNEKGADPKVAAAIVGNTWHEGAGFQTTVRGDNGNSFGEFQFNNKGEMPAFSAWARQNGRDVNDWKSQYDFVWDARLKGPYKQVLQRMQEAPDERSAANVFMRGYERPSIPHLDARQNYAGMSLKLHTSGRQAGRAAETASGAMDGLPEAPKAASAPAAVPLPPTRPVSAGASEPPKADTSGDDGALPISNQGMSDDFGAQASAGGDEPREETALPISGDDWSEEFAEGGMAGETMQPQPAPEAPLPQALDAALKAVQSGYELEREDAALPGTDTARAGRLQAFHQGEGAVSPEQYDALLQGVGGPDPSASALQQIYGFYAQKDPRQAAQAAAGVLQAARARSMQYGEKAAQALDQSDFRGAAQALAAAYNEVPDGRSVTAEVNEQGVGRAIVKDARSGKVVEELRLEPRALMQYASGFMGGGEFYNHLARIAQPSQGPQGSEGAGVPMQSYADGGLVDEEPEPAEPDYEREDEELFRDTPEADLPAPGAVEVQQQGALPIASPHLKEPAPPRLIPPHPDMNSEQRRTVERLNAYAQAQYRQDMQLYRQALGQQQRAVQEQSRFNQQNRLADRRTEFSQQQANQRNQERIEAEKRMEAQRTHAARMKDDPDYRRKFELEQLDGRGRELDRQQGALESSAFADMHTGISPEYGRVEGERDTLQGEQLNVTARSAKGGDPDRAKLETSLQALVTRGKPDKTGKVDEPGALKPYAAFMATDPKTGKPNPAYDEDKARVLLDIAEGVGRTNQISNDTLVRAVMDMSTNKAVHPRVVRDVNGVRVQVGTEKLFMDYDTFRRMAMFRAENLEATAQAQAKKAEASKQSQIKSSVARAGDDPYALPLDWKREDKEHFFTPSSKQFFAPTPYRRPGTVARSE